MCVEGYSVGILLVLICNTVAPSPFPDKWCHLAASDAGITVMNDTVHINIAPPLLLYSATLLSWQERWAGGFISLPQLSLSYCPLNLSLSLQTQILKFSFCIQAVRSNQNNKSRAKFNNPSKAEPEHYWPGRFRDTCPRVCKHRSERKPQVSLCDRQDTRIHYIQFYLNF